MKKLNVFIKVALTSFMITFLCFSGKIYGAQLNSDQYMMLYGKGNGRPTGFYWVSAGNKANKPVIKVVKSSDSNGTSMKNESSDEAIFCIKDGIGFGSSDGANGSTASVVNYNQYFDMRKPDEIASPYKNNLPQDNTNYKKLMWVLEHSVNPSDTAATAILLNEAGISDSDFNNYKQSGFNNNSIDKIKKDVIEVAQQAAIWHYTNSGTDYDPGDSPNFFRTNNNTGDTDTNIDDLYNGSIKGGNPITVLYSYFIDGADKATNYDYTQSGLTEISLDKSSVDSKTEGTNFIIGPYKINKTGSDNFNLVATITDGTNALNNAEILKSDKTTEINGANYSEKVKNSIGSTFYISVPVSDNLSKVVLSISGNTTGKTITYWSAPADQISVTQPIAIVKNETKSFKDSDEQKVYNAKFDLALRKFIVSINGVAPSVSREPVISQDNLKALANGTAEFDSGTTVTKTHTKDPLTVKAGDKVVYTIRVYNEGEIDGKATEITDYLPEGLTLTQNSTINNKYGWKADSTNSKKITSTYLSNTNLTAFNKTPSNGTYTISYADVQVECDVIPNLTSSTKLKNVAEISKDSNAENKSDRDSTPGKLTEDQIKNYNPGTPTKGKGYEDDDDYEDLKPVIPEEKQFDLALRKFIVSINGVAPSVSREPVISQDNLKALANGTAEFDSGSTVTKTHTKDPLTVKAGDKVVYTIRVYNEGEIDGKATEITDYLPEGLTLTQNSTINNKYGWKADSSNSKKITSTYLSNTNLVAFNKTPADGNYKISYADVQVECDVIPNLTSSTKLKNVAEISKASNAENKSDRDSTPGKLTEDQIKNYNPGTSTRGKGYEDDDDYEDLKPVIPVNKQFDLALRKFIVSINGVAPKVSREPVISQDNLKALADGTANTFDKTTTYKEHTKDPLAVSTGDKVVYTIRIYNEGDVDGKATEITDYLPDGLKLTENSEINKKYGWQADANNAQTIKTTYLANTTLKAFNKTPTDGQYVMSKDGGQIADVQIECDVIATSAVAKHLKNVAEISKEENAENLKDRDSTPGNLKEDQIKNYNPGTSTKGKGYEDDDDYEDLLLSRFDLALRKFITGVNEQEVTNREPQVDTSKFGTIVDGKEVTTCTYNHTKEPVRVEHNDIVTYTIRIYNEGTVDGYAAVVKDDLPEGIVYLPEDSTNIEYRWKMYDADGNETDDVTNAAFVTTDYLSKEQEKTTGSNLLKAFDKDNMDTPDYRDVKIAFRVTMPNTSDRIVINKAQISKHTDSDGKEPKDTDSVPDKWNDGEDDQDIEKIYVKYFDLALRKWVTQAIVIEDGQEKVMDTGHKAEDDPESVVKVEINKKRLKDTVVKFRYSIRITNEGEIAGYATEISDYIPKGLKFNQADNPQWREVNGKIVTNALKDTLLQPGEQGFVDVLLTWENDENNMGVMTNVAEISEDKNDSDTPDIDSTPNNKKDGEDDIDDAPVALTVNAGKAPTYFAMIAGVLSIIGTGAILIKKFVI